MEIIVLKGVSNRGKTDTLKWLICMLLDDKNFKIYGHCREFYKKLRIAERDVWAKFCCNGKHIAIYTMGDSAQDTKNFAKDHTADCDIFVCASHTTSDQINKINEMKVCGNTISYEDKKICSSQQRKDWEKMNQEQAKELFDKILKAINTLNAQNP